MSQVVNIVEKQKKSHMITLVDVKTVLSYQFLQQFRLPKRSTPMEETLPSLHDNKTQIAIINGHPHIL